MYKMIRIDVNTYNQLKNIKRGTFSDTIKSLLHNKDHEIEILRLKNEILQLNVSQTTKKEVLQVLPEQPTQQ